ncbi:MAG: exonuclease [Alphaproteobacteria bacterium]|nr:exonuclease [Alphaproteobacteria bacterium]
MPAEAIIFDTEFTAWKGSMERLWSGPGEHREIVQIGAISIDVETLKETASFAVLIKPVHNPVLSDYLVKLTGITNARLEREGTDFHSGVARFVEFIAGRSMFCYGRDDKILAGNARLLGERTVWPRTPAFNLRDWLVEIGIPLSGIHSGMLAAHVGAVSQGVAHDAVVDSRSLAEAIRYLVARGAPNPLRS